MTNYQITGDGQGGETLTFINLSGQFVTINSTNPGYVQARSAVLNGDTATAETQSIPLYAITDLLKAVDAAFDSDGTMVTYNGRSLSPRLSETLIGYARAGDAEINSLAAFIGLLDDNPSANSVNQLFDWIDTAGLILSEDGHIIGYKGVTKDSQDNYVSCSSGWGFVNGEAKTGRLRNNVGDVVSMKRNEVADNPLEACSQGLHVGSHNYAAHFGQYLLTVKVNPADVVSVPKDCNAEKMRCSRYEVVGVNEHKVKFPEYRVWFDGDVDDDEDDEDYWF
jgi:hypothetical protein